MGKPIVDARHAAQGELHFDVTSIRGKIPNPVIKILLTKIQHMLAESGYVNVTIAIKKSPPLEETMDARGQVALRLRDDGSGLKGPVIEITTLDGRLAGECTLAMTRDGFMTRIPPPRQLLKTAMTGRNRTVPPPAMAAIGSAPASREFDTQQESSFGPMQADSARFYGASPAGSQPPRSVPTQRVPTSSAPIGSQPPRPVLTQRVPTSSAPIGSQPPRAVPVQKIPASSASAGSQPPRVAPMQRIPASSAPVAPQPPRPVPMQKIPASSAPRRAPVPANAFSQNGYNQPGGTPNRYQGQQPGFDKNSNRQKGGCCSCFGGGSGGGGDSRNKSEKERRRREKKERKKAEKSKKKQKQKGKNGSYGDLGGMYTEKSGFYDDRKKRGGCCSWRCC